MLHDPICIPWITDIPLKLNMRNKLLNQFEKCKWGCPEV